MYPAFRTIWQRQKPFVYARCAHFNGQSLAQAMFRELERCTPKAKVTRSNRSGRATRAHSAILRDFHTLSRANAASSRRQPHFELAAGCLSIAQKRLCARQRLTAFKSSDRGLAGAHPSGQLSLRETCAQASPEQLGGNLELRSERVVLRLDFRIGQETSFEFFERDRHVTFFARCNRARS